MKWTRYQLRYLADRATRKIVNKSRRIGFSEAVCFESACRAAGVEMLPGLPVRIVTPVPQNIFSASKPQAIDLLARVVRHLRVLEIGMGRIIAEEGKEIVRLRSGIMLRAFSTNARSARGGEGDVVLDEFANVMRQEDVWRAVKPLADRTLRNPNGYHVRIISTPLGDDNLFYRLCEGPAEMRSGWSYHKVDIHSAIADGFEVRNDDGSVVTADDLRAESADPDLFAQEYECNFMASSARYIARDIWDAACYDDSDHAAMPRGLGAGIFAGMDVGAGGHESVIVDLERNSNGALWQIAHADRRREPDWSAQEEWVSQGMQRRQRIAVDASGIGAQFGQRLEHRFPGQAESVKFTLQSKEQLATGLKLGLSRKVVRPMASDVRLMRDVLAVKRVITDVGNVRYDAEAKKHSHADGAWALALAVYAGGGAAREATLATRLATPDASGITGPRYRRGEAFR